MKKTLDELLPAGDQRRVVEAIGAAERASTGEVKVHLESRCAGGDSYKRAVELFGKLALDKTRDRNAVLIYVAVDDHKFAILGDAGIHNEVGAAFWSEAAARMTEAFRRGALGDGLVGAIAAVGERLSARFPPRADDKNEIDDGISHE